MKKITSTMWDRIEKNPFNSYAKIGYYDASRNEFNEVVRWCNTYNSNSGANYGMLSIWAPLFGVHFFESQGGYNTCGGYNKPIANLEGCLYQFKQFLEKNEIVHEGNFEFSNCGSINSLLDELKGYLQKMYNEKLFIIYIV